MLSVLIVLGWVVLFAVCLLVGAAFYGIARESRKARKQLAATGFAGQGPLAVDQPVFFCARPCCPANAVVEAAFSQIPALHYHTQVSAYYSRSRETVFDRTETAPFDLMMGEQRIHATPTDAEIIWLTAQVNAYHGLAGRMTEREKQRLAELGVESIGSGANPMRATAVEEDLLPLGEQLWIYGRISPQAEAGERNDSAGQTGAAFVLKPPSESSEIIIAMSARTMAQQLRYQHITNLSAAVFICFAPIFTLIVRVLL